jgi:hypothetical protein
MIVANDIARFWTCNVLNDFKNSLLVFCYPFSFWISYHFKILSSLKITDTRPRPSNEVYYFTLKGSAPCRRPFLRMKSSQLCVAECNKQACDFDENWRREGWLEADLDENQNGNKSDQTLILFYPIRLYPQPKFHAPRIGRFPVIFTITAM